MKPSKPPTTAPTAVQRSQDKKDTKKIKEEDFFDDNDDVFQQYMPQDVDSNTKPVQDLQATDSRDQVKGIQLSTLFLMTTPL